MPTSLILWCGPLACTYRLEAYWGMTPAVELTPANDPGRVPLERNVAALRPATGRLNCPAPRAGTGNHIVPCGGKR